MASINEETIISVDIYGIGKLYDVKSHTSYPDGFGESTKSKVILEDGTEIRTSRPIKITATKTETQIIIYNDNGTIFI